MNIKIDKNSEENAERDSNEISNSMNEKKILIKKNDFNCFIYEDNNRCDNEDFFIKEKETNDSLPLDKHKNSNDLNLTSKDLHEFLNDDLIKALDNDLVEPKDICDISEDCNSVNEDIEGSSECTSKANSPEFNIKYPKIIKDINMNLNSEISFDKKDSNDINNNCFVNKDNINNSIKNVNNSDKNEKSKIIEEDKSIVIDTKEKSKLLKNSIFSPKFISKKINNNIEDIKQKEEKEKYIQSFKDKEKKNNSLKNKFDDDVEPTLMLPLTNWEEKTKLPSEIRVGDWICLYCNNLNFSFRKKCNRCGLFRKSSTLLLKHQYFNNKYQNMENFYNTTDGYYMDYNQNIYEGNYNINNYYNNENNL